MTSITTGRREENDMRKRGIDWVNESSQKGFWKILQQRMDVTQLLHRALQTSEEYRVEGNAKKNESCRQHQAARKTVVKGNFSLHPPWATSAEDQTKS